MLAENATVMEMQISSVSRSLIAVNAKLDLLTKVNQEQVTKLADRLVEMAMVRQGSPGPASVHRSAARMEKPAEGPDLWESEDKWPPEGHVSMEMP